MCEHHIAHNNKKKPNQARAQMFISSSITYSSELSCR